VAFVGFEGEIMRTGDNVFREVEFMGVDVAGIVIWMVVIYGLVYLYCFADIEHGRPILDL